MFLICRPDLSQGMKKVDRLGPPESQHYQHCYVTLFVKESQGVEYTIPQPAWGLLYLSGETCQPRSRGAVRFAQG